MNFSLCVFVSTLSLIFYSCNYNKNEKSNDQKKESAIIKQNFDNLAGNSNGTIYKFNYDYYAQDSIGAYYNDIGQLVVKFNVDSLGHHLKSVKIYSGVKLLQVIHTNKEIERNVFRLVDCNFDGFKDISVFSSCGSGGCDYWIWNYSPKDKKFYYNSDLSNKLGLIIDSLSKSIIFHYRGGWDQESWDTLKYRNNQLLFVNGLFVERWIDANGQWEQRTHKKIIKGKLIRKVDRAVITKQ
jgi:hypothetical protein